MCGRFYYSENIDTSQYIGILERKYDQMTLKLWAKGEITPQMITLTLDENNEPALMKWNYRLFDRDIINTRIETLTSKDYYRGCKPCVIIASGFYEWDSNKNRYYISTDHEPIYLAGICQKTDGLYGYSIITREATLTKDIHHRSPVILDRKQAEDYLLKHALRETGQPLHIERG